MKAFAESVDKFLSFNEYEVLTNKGIYQNYKLIRKQLLSIKNLIVRRKYSLILTESYTNKTSNMMRASKRLSNRIENA